MKTRTDALNSIQKIYELNEPDQRKRPVISNRSQVKKNFYVQIWKIMTTDRDRIQKGMFHGIERKHSMESSHGLTSGTKMK